MIRGDEKPKDSAEELAFADLAFFAKQFTASARMFGGAFRSDPKLAEDMTTFHRYNAACAAARAAASAEGDQARLSEQERRRWRKQAIEWLKMDLAHWTKQVQSGPTRSQSIVNQKLTYWKTDTDLAAIRDEKALKGLPEDEQKACRSLWTEVDMLVKTTAPR